jgi:hypothetical protein
MTRTYYTLLVFIDKDKNKFPQIDTAIETIEDGDMPEEYVSINPCYIAFHRFYRTYNEAKKDAKKVREQWPTGKFNEVLDGLITEIAGYKTT